jgi:Hypervirulence associated proteins TUDOR domain
MSDNNTHKVGDSISWKWGNGEVEGKIIEVHTEDITREIKGKEITRHGTKENPAYLIEKEDGDLVLKLGSELEG